MQPGPAGGGGFKVMVWTQLADWQPSLAVHVRVMTVEVTGQPVTVTSTNEIAGDGLQLSVAVAEPSVPGSVALPQFRVQSGGQVITGGIVSFTVIVCVHVLVLPQASVAE
jgi:hypothetical protein